MFREHVASFIEARDGYPSNANNIFLTNGASSAIQLCLECILENEDDTIMLPSFHYQIYSDKANSMGRGVIRLLLFQAGCNSRCVGGPRIVHPAKNSATAATS